MKKIDATLISSASNIKYFTNYFNFSENEREALILKTKNEDILITDKRYIEELKKTVKNMTIYEIGAANFISNESEKIFKKLKIKNLSFEENDLTYLEYEKLNRYTNLVPINIDSIREIKKINEIKNIKKACQIGDDAFSFILKKLKSGITEIEASYELDNYIRKQNAKTSFEPIIAFGKNSSIPHHQTSKSKLKKNQIVLMDFGVQVGGYCSDMTRTVFFGKADEKFIQMYKTTFEAQKMAINKIESREKVNKIDMTARKYIKSKNYPNMIHALGHGIGIDVHESPILSPKSNQELKNNMVFTIEPGIYISGYGGVRIEDMILIQKNKPLHLTHSSKELIELTVN